MKHRTIFFIIALLMFLAHSNAGTVTMKATKKHLNIPVSHAVKREVMEITVNGAKERPFEIRLAQEKPDYWVFCDISTFKGKTLNRFSYNKEGVQTNGIFVFPAIQ